MNESFYALKLRDKLVLNLGLCWQMLQEKTQIVELTFDFQKVLAARAYHDMIILLLNAGKNREC